MKYFYLILTFLVLTSNVAFAEIKDLPDYTNYVNDYTSTLSESTIAQLNQQLKEFDNAKTTQIAVAIINTTGDYPIEEYSLELARKWGIGQKNVDNGVLLLVAINDRTLRIEVGYGVEGALTDALSRRIIEEVITPQFKNGDFDQGIIDGVQSITSAIADEKFTLPENTTNTESSPWLALAIFFFFYGGVAFLSRNKSYWEGAVIGAIIGALFIQDIAGTIALAVFGLILDFIVSQSGSSSGGSSSSSSSGWDSSSSSSSSWSSSSSTSFGGGSFGGGGASGKW